MKTTHRVAATLLAAVALAGCATDTDDENDAPQEDVTNNDEDDETDD